MAELPPALQQKVAEVRDIEATMLRLFEHLKYPVDQHGHVLDMNHLPDVPQTLAYHLTRLGWRFNPGKALIKPRKVDGAGFYEDLVTYVPVDAPDDPLVVAAPERSPTWSVRPQVNVIEEPRMEDTE